MDGWKAVGVSNTDCIHGSHFSLAVLTLNDKPDADTFIELPGFTKGCLFVNGFNLGRFWKTGPQKRFYLPAPLLRQGENSILVFESSPYLGRELIFHSKPDLGEEIIHKTIVPERERLLVRLLRSFLCLGPCLWCCLKPCTD